MGCCENKSIQTDFLFFPERQTEKLPSFDEMSIYSEGEELRKYINSSTHHPSNCINTYNSVELAFLMGSILGHSKSNSMIIPDELSKQMIFLSDDINN